MKTGQGIDLDPDKAAVIDLDLDSGQTKRMGELDQRTRKTAATRTGTGNRG
jgi:hypothetical protein